MDEEIPGSANVTQIYVKKSISSFFSGVFLWRFLCFWFPFHLSFTSSNFLAFPWRFSRFWVVSPFQILIFSFFSGVFLRGIKHFILVFYFISITISILAFPWRFFALLSSFPSQGSRFHPSVKTYRPFCTQRRTLQSVRVTFRCPSLSWSLCNPCRAADTWKSGATMVITCSSYERFAWRLVRGKCRHAGHPNVRGGVGNGVWCPVVVVMGW